MNNDKDILVELINEALRIAEDTEHSTKAHFEAARIWHNANLWLGVPATALAALAGISAVAECKDLSVGFAIVVAILSGLLTFLRPSERMSKHLDAGNDYNAVRNDARIFANIKSKMSVPITDLENQLFGLNSRRKKLNSESPAIPRWAYLKGKAGIERGESQYKVDN